MGLKSSIVRRSTIAVALALLFAVGASAQIKEARPRFNVVLLGGVPSEKVHINYVLDGPFGASGGSTTPNPDSLSSNSCISRRKSRGTHQRVHLGVRMHDSDVRLTPFGIGRRTGILPLDSFGDGYTRGSDPPCSPKGKKSGGSTIRIPGSMGLPFLRLRGLRGSADRDWDGQA